MTDTKKERLIDQISMTYLDQSLFEVPFLYFHNFMTFILIFYSLITN